MTITKNSVYQGNDGKWHIRIPIGDDKSMRIGPYPTKESATEGLGLIELYRKTIDKSS